MTSTWAGHFFAVVPINVSTYSSLDWIEPIVTRQAMQALALLHLTLPDKYADVCTFLKDGNSGRVPGIFVGVTD